MKTRVIILLSLLLIVFLFLKIKDNNRENNRETIISEEILKDPKSPPSLQMYYNIKKYAKLYNIPEDYLFGIAYKESRYYGPFDWDYKHNLTSSAMAFGPMQVQYNTAKMFVTKSFTTNDLLNDIPFNVEVSAKAVRHLHDVYKDWKKVFGCYNTGRPIINDYAIDVYNFKKNWVSF